MYVKKGKAENLFAVTSENFQKNHVKEFTDMNNIEDFQLLLNEIAKTSKYVEGKRILTNDLLRIKNNIAIILNTTKKNMVDNEKEELFGIQRIQYDPFSALVTLNDYLYAMTMKTLGSPDIPESFGKDMQKFIKNIAHEAEFEIKKNDYNKCSIDKSYKNQRGRNANSLRKTNKDREKQILSKEASPYRVAQYAGEYFALKKRQEGHGKVWKFFHQKENEARMKLLSTMEKTLKTVLEEGDELDQLKPDDIAKIYNINNLAQRATKTFQSDIAKRNGVPANFIEHKPTTTERTEKDREKQNQDDIELEDELRMPLTFDENAFKESEPVEETYERKVEDKTITRTVLHDDGDHEIDLSNFVTKL